MSKRDEMAEAFAQESSDIYGHASGEISVMPDWVRIEIATAYKSGFDAAIEEVVGLLHETTNGELIHDKCLRDSICKIKSLREG